MSEEQNPDTTEAVERAIYSCSAFRTSTPLSKAQTRAAIAAHNEELARLGYVTVKPVQIETVISACTDYSIDRRPGGHDDDVWISDMHSFAQELPKSEKQLLAEYLRSAGLSIEVIE